MSNLDKLTDAQLRRYTAEAKSPALCAIAEAAGLLVGFGGLGIMLAGRTGLGVLSMLVYWLLLAFAFVLGLSIGGILLLPFMWAAWCVTSIVSAIQSAGQHNKELVERLASRPDDDWGYTPASPTDSMAPAPTPRSAVRLGLLLIVAPITALWILGLAFLLFAS